MTRSSTLASFSIIGLLVLLLAGCVAPAPQIIAATPQVIMQGDTPGKEEVQPIELDNCNGKADTKRIEQRTRSIESTISAEIAAKFGASAEVLSAEVQAAVGAAMKWGAERSTSIELVAPPGTRMAFQLVWIGDEQVGIVQNLRASNIPIAFRSFKPTDVRIKSQYDIGCPPTSSAQRPVAAPETHPVAPTALSPTVRPATQPVPSQPQRGGYCYGQCWQYDDSARTMTWTGPTDGIEDIWQPDEALRKIREGYTAIFSTSVPGEIFACILTVNGQTVKAGCDGGLYQLPPGTYRATSANPGIGGFRWCPVIGYGWRTNGGTCG